MSTPVVVNRSPAFGTQAGVGESTRCSIRGSDGEEIIRSEVQLYLGSGPAFYPGGILPEEHKAIKFRLVSLFPNPDGVAERTVELDNSLKITKGLGTLAGVYEFGGEQSPAIPQAILMGEFKLSLAQADVTVDTNDFTGVIYGLKSGDTGVQVKFFSDGGTRWIEVHHAELTTITSPNPAIYSAVYDWDQGVPHTYKILWDPESDKLRLYVSSGPLENTPDEVLIDGLVSDFLTPLPAGQIPPFVPIAYFGHGYTLPESTSYWHSAYLHNIVTHPIVSGIARGGHEGFIYPDSTVEYLGDKLPRAADRPWTILPDSFGDIGGLEEVSVDKRLVLRRINPNRSFGFYRVEPSVFLDAYTILNFRLSGILEELDPSAGGTTGAEVYLDDGTKKAVLSLLSNNGVQSIGLLVGDPPNEMESYLSKQWDWVNEDEYRIIFRQGKDVRVVQFIQTKEGIEELEIAAHPYSSLPSSDLPGPGVGFLLNGNTISSLMEMKLGLLRYFTNVQLITGSEYPLPLGWSELGGGGSVSTGSESLRVDDTSDTDTIAVYREDLKLDSENGFFAECWAKVSSYSFEEEETPIRRTTGSGFSVDDGTYQHTLIFAEAGAPDNKIVFLATESDYEENLLKIRSRDPSVIGTYISVDWSKYHLYRLEKTTGGFIRLYIDNEEEPSLEISQIEFQPAPTVLAGVQFGGLSALHKSLTLWRSFSFGVSMGFDLSSFPVMSENDILARFDHAFNVIVEGANSV